MLSSEEVPAGCGKSEKAVFLVLSSGALTDQTMRIWLFVALASVSLLPTGKSLDLLGHFR